MKARGKREAKRSASPLDCDQRDEIRPERPKYHGITPFQGFAQKVAQPAKQAQAKPAKRATA